MNISAPFIRRPIGTLLLAIGIALAGVGAFLLIPVAPLPNVDVPTIVVSASLAGASPATMASSIASPLERRLGAIAGITQMTSQSGVGSTRISVQFDFSRTVNSAARDVQAAINAARADLPATLNSNPTYNKVNPADAPIMILTLTSATKTPAQVYDAVSTVIQQRLLQVEGVGNVELGGAAQPSVRVALNPLALARFGIALEDVRTALGATSANRPRGLIEGDGVAWQIYSDTPGLQAAQYSGLPIAWRNGSMVRLSDVADVQNGPQDVRTMGLYNGENAVSVVITRQPGANIVRTVDAVRAALPLLSASLPADVGMHVAVDRTTTIRASLHEIEVTLLIATLLVVAVVSLFLRSTRVAIVPAIAVVVSLLGTVAVMFLAGFSLNNLSLMALTVATGFVVDDAIVVLENISRHIEEGMSPPEAALQGAAQVNFTVLSISLSLIAVFIPLLFMGGIVGRFFREFAMTMSVAVMISLFISLTTTPMLAALLLHQDSRQSRLAAMAERAFAAVQARYTHSLDWSLRHRTLMLALLAGTVALNVLLLSVVPKGFFPEQDTGALMGGIRADQSTSFTLMQQKLRDIVAIIHHDPAVSGVVAFTGGARAGGAFLFVSLKPEGQRASSREVINRLRPKLAQLTGISAFLNPVQDMQVGGRSSNSSYQYTLQADSQQTLVAASAKMFDMLKRIPLLTDLDIDQQNGSPEIYIHVDRKTAARLGISNRVIDAALYDAFGQRQVATIYAGLNQYHIVMGVADRFNGSPDVLNAFYLPVSASGQATAATGSAISTAPRGMTPLSTIAHWEAGSTAAVINHQNGEPATTISFNLANGVSLGQASDAIIAAQASAMLPATVHGGFAGTAQVMKQSTASIPLLIVIALATIYLVLGILYESTLHPLTILSTIPAAGVGAVLSLMIMGMQFDLIGMIAIILLIGIVKKNAILIIDFALEAERRQGLGPLEAIRQASLARFRPIIMTTLAAALGALPLAIGFGAGAELRRPLGVAIVGGLIAAQFVTLYTTPVVFLSLDRFRHRPPKGGRAGAGPDSPDSMEPA